MTDTEWVMVPRVPTEEMVAAGRRYAVPSTQAIIPIYTAMLAASPVPPSEPVGWRDPITLAEPKESERNTIYLHLDNGNVLLADASAYVQTSAEYHASTGVYLGQSVQDEWSGYVGWEGDLFERDESGWHCWRYPNHDETKVRIAVRGWLPAIKDAPGTALPPSEPVGWRWRVMADPLRTWVYWGVEPKPGVNLADEIVIGRDVEIEPLYSHPSPGSVPVEPPTKFGAIYDRPADVLYLTIKCEAAVSEEGPPGFIWRRNPDTREIVGLTIMDFSTVPGSVPPSPPRDEVVEALRELTTAFVDEFGSDEYEPDESSVYVNRPDGEGITFGMLRRARAALAKLEERS